MIEGDRNASERRAGKRGRGTVASVSKEWVMVWGTLGETHYPAACQTRLDRRIARGIRWRGRVEEKHIEYVKFH